MSTNIIKDQQCKENKLLKDIFTTPYEKVLLILLEIKTFITRTSETETKLINDLEWAIKVIISHSLYDYDIQDTEKIEKMTKGNPELQKFIQFINDYNEEIIQKSSRRSVAPNQESEALSKRSNLHRPSIQLKKVRVDNEATVTVNANLNINIKTKKSNVNCYSNKYIIGEIDQTNNNNSNNNKQPIKKALSNLIKIPLIKLPIQSMNQKSNREIVQLEQRIDYNTIDNYNHIEGGKNELSSSAGDNEIKSLMSNWKHLKSLMNKGSIDSKAILSKDFNIFKLEKIVGHSNVLLVISKTIFEEFGINDTMINMNKLDSFLMSIANSYFSTVPYHNSMHGADVALTAALYIIYSDIEEIANTNVVDILSLFIACLSHDIGHPGLTNNYQINSHSEMALTYNDISCLENFHTAKLFRVSKIKENNIFETMPSPDFKLIRKRIISMILATDMSNHGKVMSLIKAKIPDSFNQLSVKEGKSFQLIPKDETNQFEIQQSLFDFLIHSSDLSHNTKPFHISLQWVELLSNEFWNQGDKEKAMKLPVSFLCERIGHDIPKSQVGFIKGFILPTFEILVNMFPTLNFFYDNAKENLSQWEKLVEEKRKKGWSPIKKSELNDKA